MTRPLFLNEEDRALCSRCMARSNDRAISPRRNAVSRETDSKVETAPDQVSRSRVLRLLLFVESARCCPKKDMARCLVSYVLGRAFEDMSMTAVVLFPDQQSRRLDDPNEEE